MHDLIMDDSGKYNSIDSNSLTSDDICTTTSSSIDNDNEDEEICDNNKDIISVDNNDNPPITIESKLLSKYNINISEFKMIRDHSNVRKMIEENEDILDELVKIHRTIEDIKYLGSISEYEPIKILGKGAYGEVYLCRCKMTGVLVAIKRIQIQIKNGGIPENIIDECRLLGAMKHPNIIKLSRIVTSNEIVFYNKMLKNREIIGFTKSYMEKRLSWVRDIDYRYNNQITSDNDNNIEIDKINIKIEKETQNIDAKLCKLRDDQNKLNNKNALYEKSMLVAKKNIEDHNDEETSDDNSKNTQILDIEPNGIPSLYLVMEYMETDLHDCCKRLSNIFIPMSMAKYIMFQMLRGLEYLEENKILHLDLKPNNILLDKEGNVRIADFGLSRPLQENRNVITLDFCPVTLWFRSPELLVIDGNKKYSVSHQTDIWSLGCIFSEIMQRESLFPSPDSKSISVVLHKIFDFYNYKNLRENCKRKTVSDAVEKLCRVFNAKDRPLVNLMKKNISNYKFCKNRTSSIWSKLEKNVNCCYLADLNYSSEAKSSKNRNYSALFKDLLLKMLEIDPRQRITAKQALQHDFFFNDRYCNLITKNQFKTMMKSFPILGSNKGSIANGCLNINEIMMISDRNSKFLYRNSTRDTANSITTPTQKILRTPLYSLGGNHSGIKKELNQLSPMLILEDAQGGIEYHITEDINIFKEEPASPPKKKRKLHAK